MLVIEKRVPYKKFNKVFKNNKRLIFEKLKDKKT